MKSLLLILIILIQFKIIAQKEDNVWLFGTSSVNLIDEFGYAWGNTILDFTKGSPYIHYDTTMTLDFIGTNASICDRDGKLMIYTNGMSMHNGLHQVVKGADTIAYGDLWEIFNVKDYPKPGLNHLAGFRGIQGAMILPWPDQDNNYAIFYPLGFDAGDYYPMTTFSHTKIAIDNNYQNMKTIYKDKTIIADRFLHSMINACRHANGRDWWIVNMSYDLQYLFLYLMDTKGVSLYKKIKIRAPQAGASETDNIFGQLYFSANGDKMGIAQSILWPFDSIYIELYDFDRSKGELNIAMRDTLKNNRVHGTLAFSPSGQYMYVSNHYSMFQYDITASDIKSTFQKIADFDGFVFKYNEFDVGSPTELGAMAHGPDGKIYIVPESNNRYLHTIEYPDEAGMASNLVQRKYMIPTSNFVAVPNFPHYRLGPLDGSPADTLGLDNHPIANFRYESDTASYLDVRFTDNSYFRPESWLWDFGDGTTFDGKKPYNHKYDQNGTYNVCLTVSNENSSNMSCKLINIGPNAIDDDLKVEGLKKVTIFPNPVETDMVLTIHNYIPEHGVVDIYDIMGKMIQSQRVYNGWNNVDFENFPQGHYLYIVKDGRNKIGNGKFVKI